MKSDTIGNRILTTIGRGGPCDRLRTALCEVDRPESTLSIRTRIDSGPTLADGRSRDASIRFNQPPFA